MAKPFYRIEMLPAKHGDALLVEYGEDRMRRMLIDGGPLGAYPAVEKRLSKIPPGDQAVELLVVTHVDTDHIEGIIRLLAMPESRWPVHIEQVWFNGWRHIEEARDLGGKEGEMMSALIHYRANDRWNTSFGGNAVRCGALPGERVALEGGMQVTLLSPDAGALAALLKDWKAKLEGEGWNIEPGDLAAAWEKLVETNKFHPGAELTLGPEDLTAGLKKLLKGVDPSKANGSSIAFIAEFGGKSCVFLGDAHMKVVCPALERLGYSRAKPLKVDAVKVSHHGSKHNLTQEFLGLVDAKHWLISTNGELHDHPDKPAIEAIIKGSISEPTLWFNYRSPFTVKWEKGALKSSARYRVKYPKKGKEGIVVEL
jgi:beta-lactamase superfamily II metal-dependent hydrolase